MGRADDILKQFDEAKTKLGRIKSFDFRRTLSTVDLVDLETRAKEDGLLQEMFSYIDTIESFVSNECQDVAKALDTALTEIKTEFDDAEDIGNHITGVEQKFKTVSNHLGIDDEKILEVLDENSDGIEGDLHIAKTLFDSLVRSGRKIPEKFSKQLKTAVQIVDKAK